MYLSTSAMICMLGTMSESTLERSPLPAEAQAVINEVHAAAKTRNFAALRRLMVSEFTWSFGGDGDVDQAIEAWKRDPKVIGELYRVTGRRCSFRTDLSNIQCPPNAGYNYRAGFTKTEQGWRMSYFVAGD